MNAFGGRYLLVLVILSTAMYAPFLGGGWLTDDFVHLQRLERSSFADVFASPDPFGFYRPIPHSSLLIDLIVSGRTPWAFRLTNVVLHTAVICAAYLMSTMLLGQGRGAFLATLAFVLTPKAHPVAVLWASARPELMAALLSLLCVMFWIRWDRGEGRRWLAAACVSYLLALMSKETAAALPLLLLVTPTGSDNATSHRLSAVGVMALLAAAVLIVRVQVGALVFAATDAHYNLTTPVSRWIRNARNYFQRAIPSPLALLFMVGIPMLLKAPRGSASWQSGAAIRPLSIFAGAWFLVFILPVLPVAGRSELYLYLPGFGICLLVGAVLARLSQHTRARGWVATAVAVYIATVGSYQMSRVISVRRDAQFSTTLVQVLARHDALRRHSGAVVVVPEDYRTEELLRGSIGGYLGLVLQSTLGRRDIDGVVAYPTTPVVSGGLWLACAYRNGEILLNPIAADSAR
jgi:hypothetical protein